MFRRRGEGLRVGASGFAFCVLLVGAGATGGGALVLDGSLGPAGPLQGPDYQITADLGGRAGANLFHSLQYLRLDAGESAVFSGPAGIDQVLVRVTGGAVSRVDGAIRSDFADGADLWLMNASGWLFGEHASLDVPGAVHVSSADWLVFSDGERFSAGAQPEARLAVSAPAEFGFLSANRASIELNGARLGMLEGGALSFDSPDIRLRDAALSAPGGRISFSGGSASNPGLIDISGAPTGPEGLTIPTLDVSGDDGGSIRLQAGAIRLDNALLDSRTFGSGNAGEIAVCASGGMLLEGDTRIRADSYGEGRGGDVRLRAQTLLMRDEARIRSASHWSGAAGDIRIDVEETFAMDQRALIEGFTQSAGRGGTLQIRAGRLELTDQSSLRVATYGEGDAGDILIQGNQVELDGEATIDASAFVTSRGDGGAIRINADHVELGAEALITSAGFGAGAGGPVTFEAAILRVSGHAEVRAFSRGSGSAGAIDMSVERLLELNGGQFTTEAENADGGPIAVQAETLLLIDGRILTSVLDRNGDGGDIALQADHLVLDGGFIQANTAAAGGRGGDIGIRVGRVIPARESLLVGGVERRVFEPGAGENVIQAAAPQGLNGEIRILSLSLTADSLLGGLGARLVPLPAVRDHPCEVVAGERVSSLVQRWSRITGLAEDPFACDPFESGRPPRGTYNGARTPSPLHGIGYTPIEEAR